MATWGPIQLRLKGSRQVEFEGEASPAPGGGSMPQWLGPFMIYANKWQTLDPTQNGPGFEVATGGTFKLSYGVQQTAAIDFAATAAEVLAALNALPALAGKIALDTDDHGFGGGAGPLPSASVSFVLDDSLAPQSPITFSDNSLTGAGAVDDWPVGVTQGYIVTSDVFTPEVDDVIEDFLREVIEANSDVGINNGGPQEVFLTDGTLDNVLHDSPPTFWLAPRAGVIDLNLSPDNFGNFSGQAPSDDTPVAATTAASDAMEEASNPASAALPTRCRVSVPLRWYFRCAGVAVTPGGVYRMSVKVGHVTAPS